MFPSSTIDCFYPSTGLHQSMQLEENCLEASKMNFDRIISCLARLNKFQNCDEFWIWRVQRQSVFFQRNIFNWMVKVARNDTWSSRRATSWETLTWRLPWPRSRNRNSIAQTVLPKTKNMQQFSLTQKAIIHLTLANLPGMTLKLLYRCYLRKRTPL